MVFAQTSIYLSQGVSCSHGGRGSHPDLQADRGGQAGQAGQGGQAGQERDREGQAGQEDCGRQGDLVSAMSLS